MASKERQSPPTERVLQVLEAFRSAPGEAMTLAEVVARTGLAAPTCLGILNTLRRRGYLARPGDAKTFVLGPAVIALGRAAQSEYSFIEIARDPMRQLSERWSCACTASSIIDGHVTVLARTGPRIILERSIEVGRRYPLSPPIGVLNVIWYPDAFIEDWLASPHVLPVRQDLERLRSVIATARTRGFVAERWARTIDLDGFFAAIDDDRIPPHVADMLTDYAVTLGERDYIAEDLDGAETLQVATVSAPVYDARGLPAMLILLYVFRDEMSSAELGACARDLTAVTRDLTNQLGGFDPWAPQGRAS